MCHIHYEKKTFLEMDVSHPNKTGSTFKWYLIFRQYLTIIGTTKIKMSIIGTFQVSHFLFVTPFLGCHTFSFSSVCVDGGQRSG